MHKFQFQIEHHLFPTLPRPNLHQASIRVRKYCELNGLPYMVDDYWTGYLLILDQLKKIARLVTKMAYARHQNLCD
ncbi:unnamed protein product [Gongylonema pulchrum]|uniref:FA_desaturase domain-containing protein n=1 Tax=Gongylonema pulchrum TaxID=637853 RepID=A0A183EZJ5_9BILA|nr:unnamed protein product [Gongylonema pulchrum]